MTPYRSRELARVLVPALGDMPVVIVTGLRQAGKSTFLRQERGLEGRRYVSLDDFDSLAAARRDPDRFVEGDDDLTIDEAQRCPELMVAIKRAVDRGRRPGRFLLSGSANFALMRDIGESLAGRALHLVLHPMTRRELESADTEAFLPRFARSLSLPKDADASRLQPIDVWRGGLPPVSLRDVKDAASWFRGYEQTYLERDVRDFARIGDIIAFRNFLRLAALRTGHVLKQSELARDARMNAMTVGRHLGILEASFVVARLPPWLGNRASRLIKAPKLHVTDSGLAAHLCGFTDAEALASDPIYGALVETYCAHQLAAILEAWWPGARLHFWHQQGRHEVDFVVEAGRDVLAIEVKSGGRWRDEDLAGLEAFLRATPRCRAGILAHGGTSSVSLGERLWAMPIDVVLS